MEQLKCHICAESDDLKVCNLSGDIASQIRNIACSLIPMTSVMIVKVLDLASALSKKQRKSEPVMQCFVSAQNRLL